MERRPSLTYRTAVVTSLATCVLAGLAVFGVPASADEEVTSLDDLLSSFGWDLATAEIKSQKLGEGLDVLFGIGWQYRRLDRPERHAHRR